MIVPDLKIMGHGQFPPQDRAVLSGVGWSVNAAWPNVPVDAERYMALEVLIGYAVVVWAVVAAIEAGQVGNKPGAAKLYSGELDGGMPCSVAKMLTSQPDLMGATLNCGDTLAGGAVLVSTNLYNFGGQNLLNGIRVFASGSKVVHSVQNRSGQIAELMTSNVLLAIFPEAEVDQPIWTI